MARTFQCTLLTPENQLFDEQVEYASIPAWDGLLGLAHQRSPLVAKMGIGPLRLDVAEGDSRWFLISNGFAQMKDNKLTLLADEAIPASELDVEKAREALKEAEARTAVKDADVDQKQRDAVKARTMIGIAGR